MLNRSRLFVVTSILGLTVAATASRAQAGDEAPPRVAFWDGMVNVYTATDGSWEVDPERDDGADVDKLEYCTQRFPETTGIRAASTEKITVWENADGDSFSGSVKTYECLQPARPAQRVMFAKGMFAMYVAADGSWAVDPERDDGIETGAKAYCKQRYPGSKAVAHGSEFSRKWRNAANKAFALVGASSECVGGKPAAVASKAADDAKAAAAKTAAATKAAADAKAAAAAAKAAADAKAPCVTWAFIQYSRTLAAATARTNATSLCDSLIDLEMVQLLYGWYARTLAAHTAVDQAATAATPALNGRREVLEYTFGNFARSLAANVAADSAVEAATNLSTAALPCLKREFQVLNRSLSSGAAMSKAVEICAE